MSDTRMTTILESQKTRRIADIVVTVGLFSALLYAMLSIFG